MQNAISKQIMLRKHKQQFTAQEIIDEVLAIYPYWCKKDVQTFTFALITALRSSRVLTSTGYSHYLNV